MAIYNYLKPLWRDGSSAVHDVPPALLERVEHALAGRRRRAEREIYLERAPELGLTIAWVRHGVSLHTGSESGYRLGRYIHAIVHHDEEIELTRDRARELFEARYGAWIGRGIEAAQRKLEGLRHRDDANVARRLFLEGGADENAPAPASREPAPVAPPRTEEILLELLAPEDLETPATGIGDGAFGDFAESAFGEPGDHALDEFEDRAFEDTGDYAFGDLADSPFGEPEPCVRAGSAAGRAVRGEEPALRLADFEEAADLSGAPTPMRQLETAPQRDSAGAHGFAPPVPPAALSALLTYRGPSVFA